MGKEVASGEGSDTKARFIGMDVVKDNVEPEDQMLPKEERE
jgi:hypothetical protein